MSDEKTTEKPVGPPKQKVWPIMVCGFALTAFGFYFVFFDVDSVGVERAAVATPLVDVEPLQLDAGSNVEPTKLEYRGADRSFDVVLDQGTTRASDASLRTTIEFRLVEKSVKPANGEGFAYQRSFENAKIAVRRGDDVTGREVTREVVRLLEATILELGYAPNGELIRKEVVSSESAQLRPTLDLINDALRTAFPPMPAEALNIGEKWSHQIPARTSESEVLAVEGRTQYDAELAAVTNETALIKATVTGAIRTTWDDSEERRGHLEIGLTGEASWLWSREEGGPISSRMKLSRQTRTPAGDSRESASIRIRLDRL